MKSSIIIFCFVLLTFTATAQNNNSLTGFPIELRYFNAEKVTANSAVLRWLAPCQTSEATFEIQHSTDAINFTSIHILLADQQRCLQPFDFTDNRQLSGRNFYRIRLITPTNLSVNSFIIPVVSKGAAFELNSMWPSVVSSSAVLNFSSGKDEPVNFMITDINGRRMKSFARQVTTGNHQLQLDFSAFGTGHYIVTAFNSSNEKRIIRFQKL
jgi:hypothetical protein